jgi:hypothetical protein
MRARGGSSCSGGLSAGGRGGRRPRTLAFAVLLHERPGSEAHYDLLLQGTEAPGKAGEALCFTWSFARPPGRKAVRCRRIFDHPSRFLSYEGPLREGQGRVCRHDGGTCTVEGDPGRGLLLTFLGRGLSGRFRLTPLSERPGAGTARGRAGEGEYLWQLAEEEAKAP